MPRVVTVQDLEESFRKPAILNGIPCYPTPSELAEALMGGLWIDAVDEETLKE